MRGYFNNIATICMEDSPLKTKHLKRVLNTYFHGRNIFHSEAVNTRYLKNHHIGCALSHNNIILDAYEAGMDSVLVFEEDAILHRKFSHYFARVEHQIKHVEWDILYLGACVWDPKPPGVPRVFPNVVKPARPGQSEYRCDNIQVLTGGTCTHALAYNHTVYETLLENISTSYNELQQSSFAIDQWLMINMQPDNKDWKCYMTYPRLATQPFLISSDICSRQDSLEDFPYKFE